jgi:mRNA interferase MazF
MKEADLVLTPVPQADGKIKLRPALFLRKMPGIYSDALVCGVSTQIHLCVPKFDEVVSPHDNDFLTTGLLKESLIRLGYLAVIPANKIAGSIGNISRERKRRLLHKLSEYLLHDIN